MISDMVELIHTPPLVSTLNRLMFLTFSIDSITAVDLLKLIVEVSAKMEET